MFLSPKLSGKQKVKPGLSTSAYFWRRWKSRPERVTESEVRPRVASNAGCSTAGPAPLPEGPHIGTSRPSADTGAQSCRISQDNCKILKNCLSSNSQNSTVEGQNKVSIFTHPTQLLFSTRTQFLAFLESCPLAAS